MAIALVSGANLTAQSANQSGFTSGAIDTTGANLIVVHAGWYEGVTTDVTLSDSYGNTWTPLTAQRIGASLYGTSRLFFSVGPTVGAGHTFTIAGAATFCSIEVAAFSGAASSPFDQQNGSVMTSSSSPVLTYQPGSVTPTEDNELVVSGVMGRDNAGVQTYSIDSSFTISNQNAGVANFALSSAMAYKIQTTAGAENPTWTVGTSDRLAATIATFKAAAVASDPLLGQECW